MASFSNAGIINSQGFSNYRSPELFYTPVAQSNIDGFYISSNTDSISQSTSAGYVSAWSPTIGSLADASNPTLADQPRTGTATLNGKNLVEFEVDGDFLQASGVDIKLDKTQNVTLGFLTKYVVTAGAPGFACMFGQWEGGTPDSREWNASMDTSTNYPFLSIRNTTGGAVSVTDSSNVATDWHYYFVTCSTTGSLPVVFYVDNVSIGSMIEENSNHGVDLTFGKPRPSASNNWWVGYIAELCVWNKVLSASERSNQLTKVNNFWGLSL